MTKAYATDGLSDPPADIVGGVLHVFHREHAGRPRRVLWMLEEIGEPYELTVMTWEQGSGEEHRARHPLKRVPVLHTDAGYVFESTAICLHLADLHPDAGLIDGLGTYERAIAYQWSIFAPAELEPPLIEAAIFGEADPERARKARGRFFKAAAAVAQGLEDRDYLVAGRFGVADVLVSTALSFAQRANFPEPFPPVLDDYLTRLFERPAYQRALERARAAPAST
ncbi:MAG: glutathione S-transferase family protein [Solirubrobacterales bacterium]|nr:glutathione S-transferase family protein [Solirubrobacterales bacterium]